MNIIDKFKGMSEDLKQTVKESEIKDMAKATGMIFTEAAIKGKKEIEAKIEENRQKIEEERKFIASLSIDVINQIETNCSKVSAEVGDFNYFHEGDIEEILSFTNEFYERIFIVDEDCKNSKVSFGSYISRRRGYEIISRFKTKSEEDLLDEIEIPLVSYYGGSSEYFLLSDKAFYFRGKHISEGIICSIKVDLAKVEKIELCDNEESAILSINGVDVLKVDKSSLYILQKYFNKTNIKNYIITEEEVAREVEKELENRVGEVIYYRIKSYLAADEYFVFLSSRDNSKDKSTFTICTNKQILIINKNDSSEEEELVSRLIYNDIVYIGLEETSEYKSMFSMVTDLFKDTTLEIILSGNKFKIETLKRVECERIIKIVNEYNREKYVKKQDLNENKEEAETENIYADDNPVMVKEDIVGQIRELAALKNEGILTEEEFQAKKVELLSRI